MNSTESNPSVVAIGNFDGLHLGHRKIFAALKEVAAGRGLQTVILTFKPHPKVFFDPGQPLIFTQAQKEEALRDQGVDRVIFLDFKEIHDRSGESFVRETLVERLHMAHVVVGKRFRFGRGRSVGTGLLWRLASRHGFDCTVVDPLYLNGYRVSSSIIRHRLEAGEIQAANRLLGRAYTIEGRVGPGHGRGRELGYPTINLATDNRLLPNGVFATRTRIGPLVYASITNIGSRPTFSGSGRAVEAHILGFDGELYGETVRISFLRKIRDELKFATEKALVDQIDRDIRTLGVDKERFFC